MKTNILFYDTLVNGKALNHHVEIENRSNEYIAKMKVFYTKKTIEQGLAKEGDKIQFKFKYTISED